MVNVGDRLNRFQKVSIVKVFMLDLLYLLSIISTFKSIMSQFTIVLLIAISCLICLFVWNSLNFKTLKKLSTQKDKELNDAKYWELKYKYEFLIAIVALITAAAGFLGYNSLQSIEIAVKGDFNKKVDSVRLALNKTSTDINAKLLSAKDSVQNLNGRVRNSQSQLKTNAEALSKLIKQQLELKVSGYQSKKSLSDLSNQLDSINGKNKIKREFYLIPNIEFKGELAVNNKYAKLKFSELRTITGDRLPVFKRPPIILSALVNTTEFKIMSIDNESFEVWLTVYGVPIDEKMAKTSYYGSFIIYPTD
jgi:Ca2+/Na+ antiporter